MKLALGTVQFGLPYGIANKDGQVTRQQAQLILNHAQDSGITHLDTAIAYGNSEEVLGEIGVSWAKLITKLPSLPADIPAEEKAIKSWVDVQVSTSLAKLKTEKLEALMLHNTTDLKSEHAAALFNALQQLKSTGIVNKVGYSIYSPAELDQFFSLFKPDIIQAPYNLFDRRLEQSGWLMKLKTEGVEVHTRSVFLQGLLLMPKAERPAKFNKWQDLFASFDKWLKVENLTASQAALGFVNSNDHIDKIVVGVDSKKQLEEVMSLTECSLQLAPNEISSKDENLINPSYWNNLL